MWVNTPTHRLSECRLQLSLSKLFSRSTLDLGSATSLPQELSSFWTLVLIKTSKEMPMNRFPPHPHRRGKPEQRGGLPDF
ncbi:hypothetical protein M2244_001572 [Rhodoferax antarcticus]|uniref:Uncharacterized protein n=1 Tax=Rhodoferax antarcticus ANT.BR TaxID=1111071 RepID=A0A1Q8YKU0_9BURK|nr:hypothetical protein [Rhodoferax antarcticus]OLP08671.1 hypothetical protein BLL52_0279 [Rhodoferax antarcticus ANT.BR]